MLDVLVIILTIVNIYFFITFKEQKKKIKILGKLIEGLIVFSSKAPGLSAQIAQNLIEDKELQFEKNDSLYGENLIYKEIEKVFPEDYKERIRIYKELIEKESLKKDFLEL